jgi:hypothetical protein
MLKGREGRSTRYYVTTRGVVALKQYGIEIKLPVKASSSNNIRKATP